MIPAQVKLIQERGLVSERNLGVGKGGAWELVLSHRAETVAKYLNMVASSLKWIKLVDLITFVNGDGSQPGQDSANDQGGNGEQVEDEAGQLDHGQLLAAALRELSWLGGQYEEQHRQGEEKAGYKQLCVEEV